MLDRSRVPFFLNLLSNDNNNTRQENDEFILRNFLNSPVISIPLGTNVILSILFSLVCMFYHLSHCYTALHAEGRRFDSR